MFGVLSCRGWFMPTPCAMLHQTLLCCLMGVCLALCACETRRDSALDPDNPVTVTLWSYGGEPMQQSMGPLVTHFNESAGREAGVIVEVVYYSIPRNLDDDVFDAASGKVGALYLPDMFCAYPGNASRIDTIRRLIDLNTRLSQSEKQQFFTPFIDYATVNGRWLLFPVAKSTEALFVNKKAWDAFAASTGHQLDDLRTWEGLVRTAEAYHAWTDAQTPAVGDGRAFMSVDYPLSLLFMSAEQFDRPVFTPENGAIRFRFAKDTARKLWDTYYIPHMKGLFRNDFAYTVYNIRQGLTIAGVTSTAFGALQFPETLANDTQPLEGFALPYPLFANGTPCAPLRGGQDVAVFASTAQKEQACLFFLRWFTDDARNTAYTLPKGYLPVKKHELTAERFESALSLLPSSTARSASKIARETFETYRMHRNKPFTRDEQAESVLRHHLPNLIKRDQRELEDRVARGESRTQVLTELMSETRFAAWYADLVRSVQHKLDIGTTH